MAEVHSEGTGKGAEFEIRLPLEAATHPHLALVPQAASQSSLRVLVIEDDFDAAQSLKELLELGAHTVETAGTGLEGVARARAFKPDLVLCDIGLPGMDGFGVARALRADPLLNRAVLVALSGYAGPEDVQRAQECGFDEHIAKPPPLEQTERVVAKVAARKRAG